MQSNVLAVFRSIISIIYSRKGILIQLFACLCTYILVVTGADWQYLGWIQGVSFAHLLFSGVIVGGVLPLFVVPIVYIVSTLLKIKQVQLFSGTLFLSAGIGWFISSLYKAFTGRVQPLMSNGVFIDTSHTWNFGFWEYGIFWGWPSSHTTVAFAMAVSITLLYRTYRYVPPLALLYAFYVGLSVTTRIHWFSEFIAGAIIGSLIGYAVATTLHRYADK